MLKWNTCLISSLFIEWHVRCTFDLYFSIVSEARNAQVTFVVKPQKRIFSFQNGKHGCLMQYLIRQSFEGYPSSSPLPPHF